MKGLLIIFGILMLFGVLILGLAVGAWYGFLSAAHL